MICQIHDEMSTGRIAAVSYCCFNLLKKTMYSSDSPLAERTTGIFGFCAGLASLCSAWSIDDCWKLHAAIKARLTSSYFQWISMHILDPAPGYEITARINKVAYDIQRNVFSMGAVARYSVRYRSRGQSWGQVDAAEASPWV